MAPRPSRPSQPREEERSVACSCPGVICKSRRWQRWGWREGGGAAELCVFCVFSPRRNIH
ncbi:hypothetical protein E2C01_089490 [Portunus trituberculatus]|uniref:Uncharacterized protein n=1 Tax=Portunus trituberculatus TaxID=210409 RepID=A0A5B7JJ62_PORTR|nr:hypothetical protein [Portunus trituberculatus]